VLRDSSESQDKLLLLFFVYFALQV